jgi:hypothetical protein
VGLAAIEHRLIRSMAVSAMHSNSVGETPMLRGEDREFR